MGGPCHLWFWGCLCGGGIRMSWKYFLLSFFDSPSSACRLSHSRLACLFHLSSFPNSHLYSCPIGSLDEKKDSNHCPGKAHPFDSRPFPAGILKERAPARTTDRNTAGPGRLSSASPILSNLHHLGQNPRRTSTTPLAERETNNHRNVHPNISADRVRLPAHRPKHPPTTTTAHHLHRHAIPLPLPAQTKPLQHRPSRTPPQPPTPSHIILTHPSPDPLPGRPPPLPPLRPHPDAIPALCAPPQGPQVL